MDIVSGLAEFGVVGDGLADDTAALQRAIDAAADTGGGRVWLPAGRYRVSGSLAVRRGVTVQGALEAPAGFTALTGTVILATGGKGIDDDTHPALFELGNSCAVRGLSIYYPEQDVDAVTPYPWTFHLKDSDNTVECVTLYNSYKGIRVGPESNFRHRIRSVHGCVLRYGIWVDNCWEIGRVENCQLHPQWWCDALGGDWAKVCAYMGEHLEGFVFGRTDWEYITNNFLYSARICYHFIHTPNGECNGHMTGCGGDGSQTAVQIDRMQRMGLLITGGEFVSLAGPEPCQVRITAKSVRGSARFVNCAFWGLSNHIAVIEGDGYASFSDCYFTNWKEGRDDSPLIIARRGRVQVTNCSFDTHHPALLIEPGVTHAIVRGNNGANGVRVIDRTEGRAVITDNEPAPPGPAPFPFGQSGRPQPGEQLDQCAPPEP